ncbi:hypothetical protein LCGC14_1270850 [marine sediment metagenome]|uniref:DnaD N-terminal domain-containing protein n=1 Tax=marine sediment metagenome TaxID=412755 RepID=A0A0F9P149_9ZZZZ
MQGVKQKMKLEYYPERKLYKLKDIKKQEEQKEIVITMEDVLLDGGFTMIPNLLIDNYKKIGLEDRHLVLIICLMKYAHVKKRPYPSQKTIADIMQKDERTTRRIIHELKEMGLIEIFKRYYQQDGTNPRRISNVYSLKGLIKKLVVVSKE